MKNVQIPYELFVSLVRYHLLEDDTCLNEIYGEVELTAAEMRTLVWLAGWEECTVENVISAIRKVMATEAKRREQPPAGRKGSF